MNHKLNLEAAVTIAEIDLGAFYLHRDLSYWPDEEALVEISGWLSEAARDSTGQETEGKGND